VRATAIAPQAIPVDEYRNFGILFPIPVLTDAEVADYYSSFQKLLSLIGDDAKPAVLAQCHLHFDWACRLATHPAILDVIQEIIGPDILVHSLSVFWKRPYDQTFVSWHQDGHYMQLSEPAFVSAWVALTPSQPANGCLRVVPGSHLRGRLPHGATAVSEKNLLSSGLEIAVEVKEEEALDVVLRPGEMSLHDLNIVHGSNANGSEMWRVGFAIRYADPRVKQVAPHHPVILARGEDRYHHYDVVPSPAPMAAETALEKQYAFSEWLTNLRRSQGRRG
jgi:non-heme Fe2+,alpha-ketoglutarate-dependent halogenase